ncbi:hypothetical protein GW17_00003150 [Ensete ventricosum]|nr:hypothetical protein GW17_00003150 [Ensete ventricosum]RZS07039.1 hypothetical protein BHM03_00037804 [Ensete ventricosum]
MGHLCATAALARASPSPSPPGHLRAVTALARDFSPARGERSRRRTEVGAWRDRIIICTGKYGLAPGLVKAFLDSGAKAVVSSSLQPPDVQSIQFNVLGDYNGFENGRFEIGDEEAEEDNVPEPASPTSDWEDSDAERGGEPVVIWNGDDEEDLSEFVCLLYDLLIREVTRVDVALQHALRSHPKLRYSCHLPNVH